MPKCGGIGIGIYLDCFLPGGNSANKTLIQQINKLTLKGNTLKKRKGGEGALLSLWLLYNHFVALVCIRLNVFRIVQLLTHIDRESCVRVR